MRYFYHENASQPVIVGGQSIQFEVVSQIAGKLIGVHAAEGQQAEQLAKLVARRCGILEITKDEYDQLQLKKKATPTSSSYGSLKNSLRPVEQGASRLPLRLERKQGVASAGGDAPKQESAPASTVADLLKPVPVAPPQPIIEGERRVGESKRKSK